MSVRAARVGGRGRRAAAASLAGGLLLGVVGLAPSAHATGRAGLHFRSGSVIDPVLGASEAVVVEDPHSHRLVLAAHAGNSLLFRDGITGSPAAAAQVAAAYRNQVNLWTSADHGTTWQRTDAGAGFFTDASRNTGDSDPDLTVDAAGTIYGAGNNLANDAVFASRDGGRTWPSGTIDCHEGDRPWLAGGARDEVFLSSSSLVATFMAQGNPSTVVSRSTDGAGSCGTTTAAASGALADGTLWNGEGKLLYDRRSGALIAPAVFSHPDGGEGMGIGVLAHAGAAFDSGAPPSFLPHEAVRGTSTNMFWKPVAAQDAAGTIYVAWTTDDRRPGSSACTATSGPLANSLLVVASHDLGRTWSKPTVLVHTGKTLLMPWLVAGGDGNVSASWLSYDRVVDPGCAPADATVRVFSETALGWRDGPGRVTPATDVLGRPVHAGVICLAGTQCQANGLDRRMGELFTTAVDHRGCVLLSVSDTTGTDPQTHAPLPLARGVFTVQDSGPSLLGGSC